MARINCKDQTLANILRDWSSATIVLAKTISADKQGRKERKGKDAWKRRSTTREK
jgi:hypothetical protein